MNYHFHRGLAPLLFCLSLVLVLVLGIAYTSPALAQQGTTPTPVGIYCGFTTSPPTIPSGNFVLVQCDTNGKLITSGGGGGGGGAATIADGADTAEGTTTDPAYTTGAGTTIALLKGLYAKLAGSLAVTGTFWQATQPVSATSLPLPTGAATSANQATAAAIGSTTSGQTGPLAQGAVTTSAPSYTTAQTNPLSLTTAGGLRVDGSAVTQPVAGVTASGASLTENPLANGGKAQSSETAVTNGQKVNQLMDLVGKLVTSPYANRENFLNCAVTDNANTATTCTGMGAQGASVKIYITDLCLTRSDAGTTAISATLNDSATTILDLPNSGGGGGVCKAYNVPLQVAANTAFQVTMSSATTSVHISASGYKGY